MLLAGCTGTVGEPPDIDPTSSDLRRCPDGTRSRRCAPPPAPTCGQSEICSDGVDNDCDGVTDSPTSCGGGVAWSCSAEGVTGTLTPTYSCTHKFRWRIEYADCPAETGEDLSCTQSGLTFHFPRTGCNPTRIFTAYEPCDGGSEDRLEFACGIGGDNSFPFDSPAAIDYCGWPTEPPEPPTCGPQEICSDGIDNDCDGVTDSWTSCGGGVGWSCDADGVTGSLTPAYACTHKFRWTIQYADCPDETGEDLSCTQRALLFRFPRTGCNPTHVQAQYEPCDGGSDGRLEFACGVGGGNSFPFDSPAAIDYCGWM